MSENSAAENKSPAQPHRQPVDPRTVDTTPADSEGDTAVYAEHRSIPEEVRKQILAEAHCCQVNGCPEPEGPDTPGLLVQRISPDPSHCSRDDPQNLTVRCPHCAYWIEKKPSRDDLPPALQTRLNQVDISSNRVEILRYLYHEGPASTSEITEYVNGLSSTVSVRRALYDLMSLDVRHDKVSERLVVKNSLENEYGLPWQISEECEERGAIPLCPVKRQTRILDALVARLLNALEDRVENPRELTADIVGRNVSQTHHMRRRAEAFQFPFQRWAKPNRSRYNGMAIIKAVNVFAAATDNVSPRHVANPLVELLDRNSEQELATLLYQYFDNDSTQLSVADPEQPASDDHSAKQSTTHSIKSSGEPAGATEHTELQVFEETDPEMSDSNSHARTGDNPEEGNDGQ